MANLPTTIHPTTMSSNSTIGFSYQVEGATLQNIDAQLRVTSSFVTRQVIQSINDKLKDQNFKVDESSLRVKYVDDQLFLEGFAVEIKEPKTVGFLSGR
jgi:hypothetical protein